MIKHIAFVILPVTQMGRARRFYEKTLGLKINRDSSSGRWVEYHLGNGCLAISPATPQKPSADSGAFVALEVDDLDATLADLEAKKVKILAKDIVSPVCRMAVIADPDGNSITLHQKNSDR